MSGQVNRFKIEEGFIVNITMKLVRGADLYPYTVRSKNKEKDTKTRLGLFTATGFTLACQFSQENSS